MSLLLLIGVTVLAGCKEKEEIPLTFNSVSLEEEDPSDLLETLPGEEIPEYEVELPEEMSSFTIAIWGETYQLPMTWQAFKEKGWEYQGEEEEVVASASYLQGEILEQNGSSLTVNIMNPQTTEQAIAKCYIAGLQIDASTPEGSGIYVNLPGNIVLQKSTLEEVKEQYGEPVDVFEGESETLLTYEYGAQRSVQLGFEKETEVLMRIDLKNLRNPKAEEQNDVSKGPTDEVKAYTSPEKIGTFLKECIVEYDGQLYQLPAPVSAFVKNGWTVNEAESDETVENGEYGYVTLEKDSTKLYTVVHNRGKETAAITNCFVTTLYGDLDTTKVPIVIAKGICLGMSEEEFLTLTKENTWDKEENPEEQRITYTCYMDEAQVDYTEVIVDSALHLVRSIKVVNNGDTELTNTSAGT